MAYKFQDHYFRRAKKESYLARAVYKLQQVQKKYRILRAGDRVLDLGAAPGSWIQLASQIVGTKGLIIGVDIKAIEHSFPPQVITLQGDIFDQAFADMLVDRYSPFDVVLSDMAPATSGIRVADSARSALLFERALAIARVALKPNGHFLAKIFHGSDFHRLLVDIKKEFGWTKVVKPDASRKASKEVYILAMRFHKK